ncbi:MAG: NAD+ synthase [bacterium]
MKITLAQLNPTVGDFKGNLEKIKSCLKTGSNDNSDLIILPELCISGYPPGDFLTHNDFIQKNHNALKSLIKLSEKFPDIAILAGTISSPPKSKGNKLYNSAYIIKNSDILFTYHKSLLPTYDVFDEARYFQSGTKFNIFKYKKEAIGISICEDAWNEPTLFADTYYPVDPIAKLNENGATVFINISASPFTTQKREIRHKLFKKHSLKYQKPFILVNQVGGNDELIFDGSSMVLNSYGELIELLPAFKEKIKTIDLGQKTQKISFPSPNITKSIHDALILGIRDYVSKCGFSQAVIGLSGGIDSAVTAVLAVRALGKENVFGLLMPSQYSSQKSIDSALKLAVNLSITTKTIPIVNMYNSYIHSLKQFFQDFPEDTTEENIQARIRGNILMAFSNKFNYLTLSTGNKSELSVGYCTLYGDMSGGLSVLADVLKTDVYRLAEYINHTKEIIPHSCITSPPSAELKPNQKDEDTLPAYDILDKILKLYLHQEKSIKEIIKSGIDPDTVKWVITSIKKSEYKRRQAPPGLKISSKAFGTGRRIPIAACQEI